MISIIVATAENGVIGKAGVIPWRLPADLAHFKQITMGHPIIMGRGTYDSIGRALPGRTNIVITRDPDYRVEGCQIAGSLEEAFNKAAVAEGGSETFVIGGESIYKLALPLAEKIYLTRLAGLIEGDRFFMFDPSEWQQETSMHFTADEQNPYDYEFAVLTRRTVDKK